MLTPSETLKNTWNQTKYLAENLDILETILEYADVSNVDELMEYIQENYIHDIEVIYYHNAMEFLKEEDPSLQESLQLMADFGYQVDDLNSELLASLLLQQKCSEELYALGKDFEEFFEEVEDVI